MVGRLGFLQNRGVPAAAHFIVNYIPANYIIANSVLVKVRS